MESRKNCISRSHCTCFFNQSSLSHNFHTPIDFYCKQNCIFSSECTIKGTYNLPLDEIFILPELPLVLESGTEILLKIFRAWTTSGADIAISCIKTFITKPNHSLLHRVFFLTIYG